MRLILYMSFLLFSCSILDPPSYSKSAEETVRFCLWKMDDSVFEFIEKRESHFQDFLSECEMIFFSEIKSEDLKSKIEASILKNSSPFTCEDQLGKKFLTCMKEEIFSNSKPIELKILGTEASFFHYFVNYRKKVLLTNFEILEYDNHLLSMFEEYFKQVNQRYSDSRFLFFGFTKDKNFIDKNPTYLLKDHLIFAKRIYCPSSKTQTYFPEIYTEKRSQLECKCKNFSLSYLSGDLPLMKFTNKHNPYSIDCRWKQN
ncbi:MAG: hypothetical protein SFU98_08115 [Leptospiraceae bacterium]|nr:hypothetical protein [Leptospiraceae bacterium]